MYQDIVFMQGDSAEGVLAALCNAEGVVVHGVTSESVAATVEYLRQWDYGDGDGDIRDDLGNGSNDEVIVVDDGYVISYNYGLTYIKLSRVIDECGYCHKGITGTPYRDPEQISWVGIDKATTFCDVECMLDAGEAAACG